METTIKRIQEFDQDLITRLFQKINEENIAPTPEFFVDNRNILLVSFTGGVISGFLYAYILPSLKTAYPKMFLYSIDVFGDFLRQGIATKLIDELKRIANRYQCSEMFVLTNKSNPAAMDLYTKTGGQLENGDDVLFVYDRDGLIA